MVNNMSQQSRRNFLKKSAAVMGVAGLTTVALNAVHAAEKTGTTSTDSNPVGTVLLFAGTAIPDGYLLCNGEALSSTEYPELFAAIGTAWGAGFVEKDGATVKENTDFNLPDMRNMTPIGANGSLTGDWAASDAGARVARYRGGAVGNNVGSYQKDAIQDHDHLIHWGGGQESESGGKPVGTHGSFYGTGLNNERADLRARGIRHANVARETRVKNAAFNFIIKCK